MVNLCSKCSELKGKKDLNIFEDYCSICKKIVRTDNPEFYKKEYQRIYRESNKNASKKVTLFLDKNSGRSRIYVCKVGENRIKIGATSIDSNRIYMLEDKLTKIDISFEPLFFYDCRNSQLITDIERALKDYFCTSEIGINIDSFKNEMAQFSKLKIICSFIESKLENSGLRYSIISFK